LREHVQKGDFNSCLHVFQPPGDFAYNRSLSFPHLK